MNRKLLVVYASRYGQTEKVARCIAAVARDEGITVEVVPLRYARALAGATDVIVAGSVYFGRHSWYLSRFVRRNRLALEERHTAFVTVCGEVGLGPTFVQNFLRNTAWAPDVTAVFAGAMSFTRYGWLTRLMTRHIATERGITDMSRDYESTDWLAVETFAKNFVAEARARAA